MSSREPQSGEASSEPENCCSRDVTLWRKQSTMTMTFLAGSIGFLIFGLAYEFILTHENGLFYEGAPKDELYVSFFRARVSRGREISKRPISVDEATCGNSKMLTDAAICHLFSLGLAAISLAMLAIEFRTGKSLWHTPLICIVSALTFLIPMTSLVVQVANNSSSAENRDCFSYPGLAHEGLSVSFVFIVMDMALPCQFLALVVHLVGRYQSWWFTGIGRGYYPQQAALQLQPVVPQLQVYPPQPQPQPLYQMGVPMQQAAAVAAAPPGMQLVQPVDQFGNPAGAPMYVPTQQYQQQQQQQLYGVQPAAAPSPVQVQVQAVPHPGSIDSAAHSGGGKHL